MKNSTNCGTSAKIVVGGLLLAAAAGCASADPGPSEEVSPATSRTELMAALAARPGDAAVLEALRQLDHQEAVQFGLVAEVTTADGHHVQFLEPEEGYLVITEKYKLEGSPLLGSSQDVKTVWQQVAPDREMPAALARLADLRTAPSMLDAASGPDPVGAGVAPPEESPLPEGEPRLALDEKHVTSSGAHFRDDQHACEPLNKDVKRAWCWLNRTGTWTESRTAETTAQVAACYAGPGISFTVKVGSKSVTSTVLAGEIQSATGTVGSSCIPICYHPDKPISGTVSDTQGASWHWGGSISGDWTSRITTPWNLGI